MSYLFLPLRACLLLLPLAIAHADDTATITALLNGPSNVVVLAPGTYLVSQITIPATKSFVGGTPRPTIVHFTNISPMVTVSSGSKIDGIAFQGQWATNNPISEICIKAGSVTGVVLKNLSFEHFQYAIETDHTGENFLPPSPVGSGMRVEQCSFRDVARGANIINSRSIICNSNTLDRVLEHGLQFWGYWDVTPLARYASDITFIGNVVSNVAGGAGIWGSAGDRILMQSNRVVYCGDMCLDLELCADSAIRDNYAEGGYYGCIGVYYSASNIVVSNNMVVNNRYAPEDINGWWVRSGIWLQDSMFKQYVTVIANTITNSTDLPRRSIWLQGTNMNHITARYNRIAGSPNWWGDSTIPHTNFSLINGALTGIGASNVATQLSSSILPATGWRYYKGLTSAPSTSNLWTAPAFDDSGWAQGDCPFWYGDQSPGYELGDMLTNYTTLYVRRSFTVANPAAITSLTLRVDYDDAMVVWLNGNTVWTSSNTPPALAYTSTATTAHNWSGDTPGFAQPAEMITLSPSTLVPGSNMVAVMGLNAGLLSSDFHLELSLNTSFNATLDNDQDGLPDDWEMQWFGTAGFSSSGSDHDQDGLSDDEEYRANTDPSDPQSNLDVASTRLDPANGMVFSWPSQPTRSYGIRSATTLTSSWAVITSAMAATPPLNVYTATLTTNTRFYRVRLE